MCGCGRTSIPRPAGSRAGPNSSTKMKGPTIVRCRPGSVRLTLKSPRSCVTGVMVWMIGDSISRKKHNSPALRSSALVCAAIGPQQTMGEGRDPSQERHQMSALDEPQRVAAGGEKRVNFPQFLHDDRRNENESGAQRPSAEGAPVAAAANVPGQDETADRRQAEHERAHQLVEPAICTHC